MFKENETLELKKSLSQLKEGIISLCSMLNKHGKGEVLFGINDEGKVCGVDIGKRTLSDITLEIQNSLKPLPPVINLDERTEENKKIITVYVEGKDTPYAAYGRYYIRLNDSDIVMNSYQLQTFFEQKEDTYTKWEQEETIYGIDDIDEDLLIDVIRNANDRGRMDYVYRNAKEALNKLGLLTENNKLNNAGYYLFSNKKPLTIKEANYPTDSRIEFGEIKEYKGNIFDCIKEAISYIQNHITYKSKIVGIQREETPEIPLRAIREIIVNSFAHCSYAKKGDFNQYIVFKSSIKIYNPGTILKGIDPKEFASGKIGSKIRNLLIASTLYKCGYIDAFGTGFDRTFTLCAKENVEYIYHEDDYGFTFIFSRKKDYLNNVLNDNVNDKINEIDRKIIICIKSNKDITIPEIAKIIGKSIPTIQRHIDVLCKNGKISRMGSRKAGYWSIDND